MIVVTAGKPRAPGMSRDDLVTTNEAIVASVTKEAVKRSPKAVVVVVSNPLDAMCHVAKAISKLPRERVVGMAGILDTARFRAFIAWETGASIKDVQTMVMGGHGDQMVPVVSATTVGGVPLAELTSKARIAKMVQRTRVGGGEIVNLLGTSAWYAPGAAAAEMVDAILLDEKRVLPVHGAARGRIRHQWPLHGGAGEARRRRHRRDREASPLRRGANDGEGIRRRSLGRRLGSHAQVGAPAVGPAATLASVELDLKGRTAIVCGASAGIGLGIAEALAAEDANVAMFARRRDILEREADRLGALAVRGDVTVPTDLERLVEQTVEAFGGIDIVVHNSGGPPRTTALEMNEETIEAAVQFSSCLRSASRLWPFPTSCARRPEESSRSHRAP